MAEDGFKISGPDMNKIGAAIKAAPPEIAKDIVRDMRMPMTQVAAQQRAAARALSGKAPREWITQAAGDVRVDLILNGERPRAMIRVRRSSKGRGPWNLNRGEWRHPLFGDRDNWYPQKVRPERWFDQTGRNNHTRVITLTGAALEEAAKRLAVEIESHN